METTPAETTHPPRAATGSALIIGAGPGIGRAVAERFARRGHAIGLIARSRATLETVEESLAPIGAPVQTFQADAGDHASLRSALDGAVRDMGVPAVAVYNAAVIRADRIGELSASEHCRSWAVNVLGIITAIDRLGAPMAEQDGSFLITSGMPRPHPDYVSLSLGKAGLRALTDMLALTYGPRGLHVAAVTVGGPVAPGTAYDPDEIAARYTRLHDQPRDAWESHICHGC